MLDVSISRRSIQGTRRAKDALKSHLGPAVTAGIRREASAIAALLTEEIKREFAPHSKTGYTLGTFRHRPAPFGAVIEAGGGAAYVLEGQRRHIIRARTAPYLVFEGERGWVRTKEVDHPAVAPDPYVERAGAAVDMGVFSARIVGGAAATVLSGPGYVI